MFTFRIQGMTEISDQKSHRNSKSLLIICVTHQSPVDTIVWLLANERRPMYMWPLPAHSEIQHSSLSNCINNTRSSSSYSITPRYSCVVVVFDSQDLEFATRRGAVTGQSRVQR